jgi:subtilisin-like proprotein convertase family protein
MWHPVWRTRASFATALAASRSRHEKHGQLFTFSRITLLTCGHLRQTLVEPMKADSWLNIFGSLSADSKPWANFPLRLGPTAVFWVVMLSSTRLGAADFTEGNASSWSTFASDNAATSLANDTNHVKAGSFSLRFDTASGFDTGVKFPGSGAAHWNLTTNTHLSFWHFGTDTNQPTWQGAQPVVVLNCAGGNLRYEPTRQFTLDNAWSYVRVPLAGDDVWHVTTNGTPSLADALSLEIHQDTWGYGFTIWYDAVQFITTTNSLPPAGPPAPPGVDPDQLRPRVLMFAFDPFMPNKNNRRMHTAYGWTDPVQLTTNALNDFRRSSHDRVVPILETQVHDAWPIQSDGFQYDAASFDYDWTHGQIHNSEYDYKRFVLDWNLAPRILNGEVDEIWIYNGPFAGMWESTMAGDGGYWCNSGPVQGVPSSRLFVIMGLNFERGVGEAIHSFGHRAESIMVHSYEQWLPNRNNTWSHFALLDKDAPGLGGIGNVHFPVNGQSDYDYANPRVVVSDADDWLNYPNFQGITRSFNYHEWSPDDADPQRQYLNWWYAHMPHAPGRAPDNFLGNWWRYLWDVEQFKSWNGSLYGTEGIPTVAITSPTNNAAVAGAVRVTADASASGALGRVDFYVNGDYQASDTIAPYTFDWDTRGLVGSSTLIAKAYELQNGTETVSAPVTVSIRWGSITGNITSNGVPSQNVRIDWTGKSPITSYAESRPNAVIPDNNFIGVTNDLGTSLPMGNFNSLSVGVTVRHSRPSDLQIDLLTPSRERLQLKASGDSSEKDYVTTLPELNAPIDGLSAVTIPRLFDNWKLVVRDVTAGTNGVLEAWSLRLKTELPRITLGPTNYPGYFFFNHLAAGVYTVTPSGSNRWFWPPTITLTNVAESNVVNFIETAGPPPLIVTPPEDQIVYAGDSATFQVVASGLSLTYQWQRSGTNLPGATGPSLVFTNVQPPDIGLYRVVVSNANGWAISPEVTLAFAELTEGNASDWDTFASDGATASTTDDTTHIKVGQRSVRFDTQSGFDTGVIYPRDGNANWNLANKSHLVMWIYADNPNFAFQGNQPVVVLKGPGGSFRYEPQQEVMPNHAWSLQQIPLAGDALWLRTVTGAPSLTRIDQLEIHQDTWDAGFTIYYDGVEFAALSPPQLANVGRDAGGKIHFDVIGLTSHDYDVEVSNDLFSWTWLTMLTSTNRSTHFENTPPGNATARFYRVKEH